MIENILLRNLSFDRSGGALITSPSRYQTPNGGLIAHGLLAVGVLDLLNTVLEDFSLIRVIYLSGKTFQIDDHFTGISLANCL